MRRVTLVGAIVLAAAGIALALAPFARQGTIRSFTTDDGTSYNLSKDCLPPVASAFRHDTPNLSGWVGYAPVRFTYLSSQPYAAGPPALAKGCRRPGAHRLEIALTLEVAAAALWLVRRRARPVATPTVVPA